MREERFPVSTAAKVYKLQEELGLVQKDLSVLKEAENGRHPVKDEMDVKEARWPKSEIYRAAVAILMAGSTDADSEVTELVPWAVGLAIQVQVEMDRQLATWVPDENE